MFSALIAVKGMVIKMKNRTVWKDIDGKNIQAHGGCIIEYDDKYYWYGKNKGQDNCPDSCRVDVI